MIKNRRPSEWVWSNTTVVRAESGLVLVDPGITGSELDELADHIEQPGLPVVAGFATHPHWDHLLWRSRFGDVPLNATAANATAANATAANAQLASEARERAQQMAAESAEGVPLDLVALVTLMSADGGDVPGELIEHDAHAIGVEERFGPRGQTGDANWISRLARSPLRNPRPGGSGRI